MQIPFLSRHISIKEKTPTISATKFILNGPLFVNCALLRYVLSTWFWTHPKPQIWNTKPFQSRRVPRFTFLALWDFSPLFWHCETFWKIFKVSQESLLQCFDILQRNGGLKIPHYETIQKSHVSSDIRLSQYTSTIIFFNTIRILT